MSGRPDDLLRSLTPEARELVPVHLRTAGPVGELEALAAAPPGESGEAALLFATSRFHRSRGYLCHDFHKPISKCFRARR